MDAALREVLEETGIPTKFESVLTFRHVHHAMFDCSDFYVVLHLKALSQDIKKCDREIADCQWMDIEEYLTHPHVHELNRYVVCTFNSFTKCYWRLCTFTVFEKF